MKLLAEPLLRAAAVFAASGTLGAGLASYARAACERVLARAVALAEQSGLGTVLFVHEAALTARYWSAGGRELLVTLQGPPGTRGVSRTACGCSCPWKTRRLRRPWTAARWTS